MDGKLVNEKRFAGLIPQSFCRSGDFSCCLFLAVLCLLRENIMNELEHIKILKRLDIFILVSGLFMPLIAHGYGFHPTLNEILAEMNYVISDITYFIFVFPFLVLSGYLLSVIIRKEKSMTKLEFGGHIGGVLLNFIVYSWIGLGLVYSHNAPQGPGLFLLPFSVLVLMPILYYAGYACGSKITKYL